KKPGEVVNVGFDTSPQVIQGFKDGWIQLASDQQPFQQGYLPILSLCEQVVYALGGVDLHVDRAEVVGLVGDNGAGKSTLIKILAGAVRPTSGQILVHGQPVSNWNAARSREAGIETVFQDRALAVQQTITRNIFMGRELTGLGGFLKVSEQEREAGKLMREIGFTSKVFSPNSIVGQLSGGERQGVA